jgi:hypothetical protein
VGGGLVTVTNESEDGGLDLCPLLTALPLLTPFALYGLQAKGGDDRAQAKGGGEAKGGDDSGGDAKAEAKGGGGGGGGGGSRRVDTVCTDADLDNSSDRLRDIMASRRNDVVIVKRSDGNWKYGTVLRVEDGKEIEIIVNDDEDTKLFQVDEAEFMCRTLN